MNSMLKIVIAAGLACTCAAGVAQPKDESTGQTRAISVRGKQLFEPLNNTAPSGNAGLFVGVNRFDDAALNELSYAVHDAIELAHLFVIELKLVPPANCWILLSGEPAAGSAAQRVRAHLAELKRAGASVRDAERTDLLRAFLKARDVAKEESNLLVCSLSSHGFEDRGQPYVMPSDGIRDLLADTAVSLQTIETNMQRSRAGHRLLLVDACQERISAKAVGVAGKPVTPVFLNAFRKPTGQAKLASCSSGEFSFEHPSLGTCGHGIFTHAFLEALRGGAAADDDRIVRLGQVSEYVAATVSNWAKEHGRTPQTPFMMSPVETRKLPLVARSGDIAALIAGMRRQPAGNRFTKELRDALVEQLGTVNLSDDADRALVATCRDFIDGRIPERLFVPFLKSDESRWGSLFRNIAKLQQRLHDVGIDRLIEEVRANGQHEALRRTLDLSRHILRDQPEELWFQLQARSVNHPDRSLTELTRDRPHEEAVHALWPVLARSDGALKRMFIADGSEFRSVCFSLNGQKILSRYNNAVSIWDTSTGQREQTSMEDPKYLGDVRLSPDGQTIAAVCNGATVKLWNAATGRLLATLNGDQDYVGALCFSPDSSRIVVGGGDDSIKLWNVKTGRLLRTLEGHEEGVRSVCFSPDGENIASGSYDDTVKLWVADSGDLIRTLNGHTSSVGGVCFSPDGSVLASAGSDDTVRLWDPRYGVLTKTMDDFDRAVNCVSFSPDGRTIVTGDNTGAIKLWDAKTGSLIRIAGQHERDVEDVCFSQDGRTIASASKFSLRIWDADSEVSRQRHRGHSDLSGTSTSIDSVFLTSNGRRLVSSIFRTGRIWDVDTGHEEKSFGVDLYLKALSPDGRTVAEVDYDQVVGLKNAETGTLKVRLEGHEADVLAVDFSPDGDTVATGAKDDTVRLWNTNTGRLKATLNGHSSGVETVCFSPNGRMLASGSWDDTLRLWDVDGEKELRTLTEHTESVVAVCFSPDGRTVASGSSDATVRLWNVSDGQLLRTLEGHGNGVWTACFSPRGGVVAVGSRDLTVRLWNAKTGSLLRTLTLDSEIRTLDWDADKLAAGDSSGQIHVLQIDETKLLNAGR